MPIGNSLLLPRKKKCSYAKFCSLFRGRTINQIFGHLRNTFRAVKIPQKLLCNHILIFNRWPGAPSLDASLVGSVLVSPTWGDHGQSHGGHSRVARLRKGNADSHAGGRQGFLEREKEAQGKQGGRGRRGREKQERRHVAWLL